MVITESQGRCNVAHAHQAVSRARINLIPAPVATPPNIVKVKLTYLVFKCYDREILRSGVLSIQIYVVTKCLAKSKRKPNLFNVWVSICVDFFLGLVRCNCFLSFRNRVRRTLYDLYSAYFSNTTSTATRASSENVISRFCNHFSLIIQSLCLQNLF